MTKCIKSVEVHHSMMTLCFYAEGLTKKKRPAGSGGIRTHASKETGALNQRLRPLGHATSDNMLLSPFIFISSSLYVLLSPLINSFGSPFIEALEHYNSGSISSLEAVIKLIT